MACGYGAKLENFGTLIIISSLELVSLVLHPGWQSLHQRYGLKHSQRKESKQILKFQSRVNISVYM